MSAKVVPVETDVLANPTSAMALSANVQRAYLQLQNKSAGVVSYRFGTDFSGGVSAVQTINFSAPPAGGTFAITVGGQTATHNYGDSAGTIQTALQALGSVGANNLLVTGSVAAGLVLTFAGALANMVQPLVTVNAAGLTNNAVIANAVQAINWSQPPTGGTFTVALGASTTPPLPYNISAANLAVALNLLDSVANSVSACTQDGTSKNFSVTFGQGPLADTVVPLMTVVSSLTGTANQASQVVTFFLAPLPIAGTFQLSNGLDTTSPLQFNAGATDVQNALAVLPSIGVGNVVVGGSAAAGYTITYQGALANVVAPPLYSANKLLVSNTLNDDDEITGLDDIDFESVKGEMRTITLGYGTDHVTPTVLTTVKGATLGSVTAAVVNTTAGAGPLAGVDLAAGAGQLWDSEVPADALYLKASLANSAVTILEG
jgi:hypothetical protein